MEWESVFLDRETLGGLTMRRLTGLALLSALVAGLWMLGAEVPAARAQTQPEANTPQEEQKQIQSETDFFVGWVGIMIRLMKYYRLDERGEKKLLEEMAGILRGLSRNQMKEVIARLDAAAKVKETGKSEEELKIAYQKHR